MNKKTLISSFMLLLASLIWGLSYSIQSLSANNLQSFTIVFCKGIGTFVLLPICLLKKIKFDRNVLIGGISTGITGFLGSFCQQRGIELSAVGKSGFLVALYIVFVPVLGLLIKRKPKRSIWLAVLVALSGTYLLCVNGNFVIETGDIYSIMAAFFFAIQIFEIDKFSTDESAIAIVCVQGFVVMMLCSFFVFNIEKPSIESLITSIWLLLYIVFLSGLSGQFIQMRFQKDLNPSVASLIMCLESVFATIFGFLILKQSLSIREVIGCLLIFVSIIIAENI